MKQNTTHDKYVINLSEGMIDSLIKKVEDSIIEYKIKQEEISEELKTRYELYKEINDKYQLLEKGLQQEQTILESLCRIKTSTSSSKQIKVYKNLSNTNQKVAKTGSRHLWIKRITNTLKSINKFTPAIDIYNQIVKETPDWQHESKFLANKFVKYCLESGVVKGKFEDLYLFKGKIGLKEWTFIDANNERLPRPIFLKEFMFSKSLIAAC